MRLAPIHKPYFTIITYNPWMHAYMHYIVHYNNIVLAVILHLFGTEQKHLQYDGSRDEYYVGS